MDSEQRTVGIVKMQNELNSSREMNLTEKTEPKSTKKGIKFKIIKNIVTKKLTKKKEQITTLIILNQIVSQNYFFTGQNTFSKSQIKEH